MSRIKRKELFASGSKRLEIRFHTSSIAKYIQARLVFQQAGLTLLHFKESQEPYHEDYNLGQIELLTRAIGEIKHRLGANSLFFVEDTSVKIQALSSRKKKVPGLKVKEWFANTTFEDLDAKLKRRRNVRNATVYSDIALHVPNLRNPVFIHCETTGKVAETPPDFEESVQYPWLTPNTFNGWFVPGKATKPLGAMSFEESLEYDFRVKSLISLLDRLEEYSAILNLNAQSYTVKRPRTSAVCARLFKEENPLLVVIGRVCAGKTTLGEYASSRYPFHLIEASGIMRMIANDSKIKETTPFDRARDILNEKGPDIVARQIVGLYYQELQEGAIISGFRTIEELKYIKNEFPDCKVIFIDASERTRFERHLARGRYDDIKTIHDFKEHDRQQWSFGLLQVAPNLADIKIENEGSLENYQAQIDALLEGAYDKISGLSELKPVRKSLLDSRIVRCLRALEQISKIATCPEISLLTKRNDPISNKKHVDYISARHVGWILKDIPELVRRIDAKGSKIHYELLPAGKTYLDAIRTLLTD